MSTAAGSGSEPDRLPPEVLLAQALEAIGPELAEQHRANLHELLLRMDRFGTQRTEPVRTVPAYMGDRWSSLVMHLLGGGMLRHADLRRLICIVSAEHEISQRMLTLKLRILERDGLIERQTTADVPPRVEYRLTPLGQSMYAHFAALVRWAELASSAIKSARERYDARHPDGPSLLGGAAAERD